MVVPAVMHCVGTVDEPSSSRSMEHAWMKQLAHIRTSTATRHPCIHVSSSSSSFPRPTCRLYICMASGQLVLS